ncbi:MAG: putative DNA binding domain-containing protein [Bifidobacterium sp.]|nr:putative DNA binding domain-containing protein [Bifidobacterium sp.]
MADRLDISKLRETNQIEAKLAKHGLPHSIWETYSSFANSEGGKILLGVAEDKTTRELSVSGVEDSEKLIRDFWNTLNDRTKVNINILTDEDISVQSENGKDIIIINVPAARRENKPVYLGPNPLTGAYRRNADGDYHCTADESRAMLRDSSLAPLDRKIVDGAGLDAISNVTLNAYRRNLAFRRPEHPWNSLPDKDFLLKLNAVDFAKDSTLHPTRAGLLMFCDNQAITREFPDYFLDYHEKLGQNRWDDRIISTEGTWSGNLYDFWLKVTTKLFAAIPHPFRLGADMQRIDEGPMDKAVREALTNTLVHADYYGRRGTVVIRKLDCLEFTNPGGLRLAKDEVLQGGISDSRNPTLLAMFNLVGGGERMGSGFDVMRQGAADIGADEPTLTTTQSFPNRTTLTVPIKTVKKKETAPSIISVQKKIKNDEPRISPTKSPEKSILSTLSSTSKKTANEISQQLGMSKSWTQKHLRRLIADGQVIREGGSRNIEYRRPE